MWSQSRQRTLRKSRVNKRGNQTDKRRAPTASLIRCHLGGLNVLNAAYVGSKVEEKKRGKGGSKSPHLLFSSFSAAKPARIKVV